MNDTPIDLLQIKIERAKKELSPETLKAIDAVNWKDTIIGMRQKRGYSFEQLEALELETELLLCGLLSSEDYPKQLEDRMKLPKAQVSELVNEMNDSVFKRIREEFIKISEQKKTQGEKVTAEVRVPVTPQVVKAPEKVEMPAKTMQNLESKKELPTAEKVEIPTARVNPPVPPVKEENKPVQPIKPLIPNKFAAPFKAPTTKTEYTLSNLSKKEESVPVKKDTPPATPNVGGSDPSKPKIDPYREIPE